LVVSLAGGRPHVFGVRVHINSIHRKFIVGSNDSRFGHRVAFKVVINDFFNNGVSEVFNISLAFIAESPDLGSGIDFET
jgi:hypothetical protein